MKKLVSVIIVSVILLAGCSNAGSSDGASDSSSTSSSAVSESASQTAESKAEIYAQAALSAVEFPQMRKISDPVEIDALFGFDTADFADFSFYTELMGVNLNKVIFVKPADGKHDAVSQALKAYFDETVESGAYYPAQQKSAAGALFGETPDGFIFIIFHENAQTAVEVVKAL
ncbi:MAG TPA: hypothetical protein DER68_02830 [Ruminococcaceae bacterium]|nr:hypothetical protein [Oscillospiraceae bacterium]